MMRIEAARRVFPRCWFNDSATEAGRDALGYYHERQDEKRSIGLGPEHDWSSHAADAFGYMAIAYEEPPANSRRIRRPPPPRIGTHWSEVFETVRGQGRVADRGHDRSVAEIGLDGASVVAVVGKLEPAGMPQHVGMHEERGFRSVAELQASGRVSHRRRRVSTPLGRLVRPATIAFLSLRQGNATTRFHYRNYWIGGGVAARGAGAAAPPGAADWHPDALPDK